ncbi:MAG TPA: ATP-binding cassette domain-containing protein [Thermoleophilaceae bacterium]|nr:ATP-binding cassette domain-containing protein [Thermoleophilaceae bacterium]
MPTSQADRPAAALVAREVYAGYGGPPIVRGATVQVGEGEVVTVVGPNGAGKSTLLKAIAGQLRVEKGSVTLAGQEIANMRTHRLARLGLGYVPQSRDVFDPLTVRENLEMGGYLLTRAEVKVRIGEVVEVLPALERLLGRRASKLSGGERKMVAIGRALMNRPHVLLLDEPTSGLSAELSRRVLTEHVRRLAETGTAILLVEQKALAALEVSDWGYVLASGAAVISSQAGELLARSDLGEVFLGRVAGARA